VAPRTSFVYSARIGNGYITKFLIKEVFANDCLTVLKYLQKQVWRFVRVQKNVHVTVMNV